MKYSYDDIAKDELIKEFFLAKNIRKTTQDHYLNRLSYYCTFIQKKPTQMIEEAENEEEKRIRMRKRKIRQYFLTWLDYLQNKKYSKSTISSYFASIKAFHRYFEIEIPKIDVEPDKNNKHHEKIPTRKDIKKALSLANLKYKSIILLMASSGMGSAEVRNLKYGDFLESIKEYFKPLQKECFDIHLIIEKLEKHKGVIPVWKIERYKNRYAIYHFLHTRKSRSPS